MKFRLFLSCVAGLLGSLAISAQANTQLAHVTNNVVDSGSCTLSGVNGGNGWASFKLTCGADIAYVTHSTGGGSCTTSVSSGYSISGGCTSVSQNSYTLYKNSVPVWIWLTDVTNTMNATPGSGCRVESAGGTGGPGVTYVGYRVVCGSTVLPVTLTYNYQQGYCSVNPAPSGYVYTGGCNSYSVYRIEYQ
ncbi:MAG TPA: hypothetical protein VL995_15345 [Cellvibrio sp.]|nr:hypothetical protein [Cellvibrio sp.]